MTTETLWLILYLSNISFLESALNFHTSKALFPIQLTFEYSTVQIQHHSLSLSLVLILARVLLLVDRVTSGSLHQFEHFSALCLKDTTIKCKAHESLNSCKLPQVVQSIRNNTQSVENKQKQCCL